MRWPWLMAILAGLMVLGCGGGSTRQVLPEAALNQPMAQAKKKKLQEQLQLQLGRGNYTPYQDYAVGPEDLLDITFFGQDELNREVRVNGQGEITMPLVGSVAVSGLSPKEVEARLIKRYQEGRFIREPQITVLVKEYRHQRVMVTGAVVNPGSYEMIGPRTLLEMLGKAGGLSEKAGDVVQVIRHQSAPHLARAAKAAAAQPFAPGAETIVIDLHRLLLGGALELNILIQSGDVIHVPHALSAYVLGAVRKPGQVPLKEKLTVTQAVSLAQGVDPLLGANRVSVIRFGEGGQRQTIQVNLDGVISGREQDVVLRENDIVFVHESGFRRFLYNFKSLMPGAIGASIPLIP